MKELLSSIKPILKYSKWQIAIVLIAFVFAIFVYVYVINFYDKDLNLLNSFNSEAKSYTFYSGNKSLIFNQVGESLIKSNPEDESLNIFSTIALFFKRIFYFNENDNNHIKIKNEPTNGSFENARNIVTSSEPSLGLADKVLIEKNSETNEQIEFVTPLYFDRLYIVYDRKSLTGSA